MFLNGGCRREVYLLVSTWLSIPNLFLYLKKKKKKKKAMLITKTYHKVPCRDVTVSLWRSKNTIFKCYSAEVAGNSASAKMQNSQWYRVWILF